METANLWPQPTRSCLFVPGDRPRKIAKAAQSAADVIIIDLEDAVAPEQKEQARQLTAVALPDMPYRTKPTLVRINGLHTPFAYDDLRATLHAKHAGYVLPKLERAEALQALFRWLDERDAGDRPLFALVESALGILNLPQIVTAGVALAGLIFGGEDYVASIGGMATAGRHELLYARSAVVMAAGAVGIPAIDTVYTDYHDLAGLQADAEFAKQLGFAGKLVIHPQQVEVVNSVWTPSRAERAAAQDLLTAYEQHQAHGIGVFSQNGRMVDEALIRQARQILARASD
ncbi:MAG: CoA ester lyase [Chloroflexi bacterium]|nr:CoA ester lyase [Chloroflexota bacterium]